MHNFSFCGILFIVGYREFGDTRSEYLRDSAAEYISADFIAEKLATTTADFDKVKIQADRLFFNELYRLIEAEKDFAVEVTLSGKGFERIIHQLQDAGWTVAIVFIFLKSPEMCIERVQNRVRGGGHHVPTEDIVRRFYRSKRNFWHTYKNQVDQWSLSYNSGEHFQIVAVGKEDQFTVIDREFFKLFMQDISNGGT